MPRDGGTPLRIQLLDTPGHMDFSAEMERTLSVLDYAILVIAGTDGRKYYALATVAADKFYWCRSTRRTRRKWTCAASAAIPPPDTRRC